MKTLAMALAVLFVATPAMAAERIDLAWEYDAAAEARIDGFRILYTDVNTGDEYSYKVPQPSARSVEDIITTMKLIPSHTYRFTCRAYAGEGESDDSNQVQYEVPPWVAPEDSHPIRIEIPAPGSIVIYKP